MSAGGRMGVFARLRAVLPEGRPLPEADWHRRHRVIMVILWAHVPVALIFTLATGRSLLHALGDAVPIAMFAAVASLGGLPRRTRATFATLGLVTASAVLVHIANGRTEMHFHYFVVVTVVGFYQDWVAFAVAIGFVALDHGLFGALAPHEVYDHEAAWRSPWRWSAVHAAFVLMASAAVLTYWRLAERANAAERAMGERLQHQEVVLRHAQKLEAVGQLAAGVAHEINTPMQFIGDNVLFLASAIEDLSRLNDVYRARIAREPATAAERDGPDTVAEAEAATDLEFLNTEIPQAVSQTTDGVRRVVEIVQALKAFAHPDGRDPAPADLNQALRDTTIVARGEFTEVADVQLDLGELRPVTCVLGDLNQVFLNLMVNAADAIRDAAVQDGRGRGRISVRTFAAHGAGEVVVEIGDTGTGITPEVRERMFEPFYTTKAVGKGSGQGLALVHAIVTERHGGRIEVDSEPGEGTTFRLVLPIAGRGAAGSAATRDAVEASV